MSDYTTYLQHTIESFVNILRHFDIKVLVTLSLVLFEFFFGYNNIVFINAIIGLVALDFIAGVFAAYKSGEKIESRKAVKTVFKLGAYSIVLAAAHLLQTTFTFEVFSEEATIAFIGATEFISIIEKIGKAGYPVPSKLLQKVIRLRDGEEIKT